MNRKLKWAIIASILMVIVMAIGFNVMAQEESEGFYFERRESSPRHDGPETKAYGEIIEGPGEFADELIGAIARTSLQPRIIEATYHGVPGQAKVFTQPLQLFPRSGSQYIALSTGWAADIPGEASTFVSSNTNGVAIPGGSPDGMDAYDVATLAVKLDLSGLPADPAPRLIFRYKFMTEEAPTYWGSEFQDFFTAWVYSDSGEKLGNIARLPSGDEYTLDHARPYMNQVTGGSENPQPPFPSPNDTVFNAVTGIHTTDFNLAPYVGEVITLEFQVGDVSDRILDSAAFIDGLEIRSDLTDGTLPKFSVEKVEFNQASQIFSPGQIVAADQLVSGTRYGTAVRAYIKGENNYEDPKAVSAWLHLYKDGSEVSGSPFSPSPLRVTPVINPSRTARDANDRPSETLQFRIPRSATLEPGNYEYYIQIDPDYEVDSDRSEDRFPAVGHNVVTFHERDTLRVLLVSINDVDGDGNVKHDFSDADLDKYIEQRIYAYKILPRHVDFWFTERQWNVQAKFGDLSTWPARNALYTELRDMMDSSDREYHSAVAIFPSSISIGANGYGMLGTSGAIVKTHNTSTLTHEIIHNWLPQDRFDPPDKNHDPSNSGDDGFWVGSEMIIMKDKDSILHMGTNEPWVSPRTYEALFNEYELVASTAALSYAQGGELSPQAVEAIRVSTWFDEENNLVARPFHTIQTENITTDDPAGTYLMELQGVDEKVLGSLRFTPPQSIADYGDEPKPGPFTLVVPRPSGLDRIIFKSLEPLSGQAVTLENDIVGVVEVSANSPAVTVLTPTAGEIVSGTYTVTWEGTDPDGDELTYTLLYSNDGFNFEVVETMLTEESYELDTTILPGGNNAVVRVVASDGVNSGQGDSAGFSVEKKAPDAYILYPQDNSSTLLGAVAGFEGEAFDLEDGELSGDQLVWKSNLDDELGSGDTIETTELSVGVHTITLTVTDSDNNTETDSITFTVSDTTPDAPTGLQATAGDGQVTLQWNASTGDVSGYRVYWGISSGIYSTDFDVGDVTTHTIPNLDSGTTYHFAVRAYDKVDNLSEYSDDVSATPEVVGKRLSGDNRFQTAIAISRDSYPEDKSADAVVIARSHEFADALPGGVLAYKENGPLLLTTTEALRAEVQTEISRVLKDDGTIYILGGNAAISPTTENQLRNMGGYTVERIAGGTRTETAYKIAEKVGDASGKAIIANSQNFPDALAISSYAAMEGIPILTSGSATLSVDAAQYLTNYNVNQVYVVGGPAVISNAVFSQIEDLIGVGNVERLGGENRYETALRIANRFFPAPTTAALAFGRNFPDALAGGVNAARQEAPVLLVNRDNIPQEIEQYLTNKSDSLNEIIVYGGTGVVNDSVMDEANNLIE